MTQSDGQVLKLIINEIDIPEWKRRPHTGVLSDGVPPSSRSYYFSKRNKLQRCEKKIISGPGESFEEDLVSK